MSLAYQNYLKQKNLYIAQEFIKPQTDGIGKKIEHIFEGIFKFMDENKDLERSQIIRRCDHFKLLEETVFERFGIRIKATHSDYIVMGVLPLILNKHHIFLNKELRGFQGIKEQETLMKSWQNAKGYVDLEKAKVSGIFSEYTHYLFMNLEILYRDIKITTAEATAILFHEIGHLFNNFEFSNHIETTNLLLLELTNELKSNNQDVKKIEYIYKQYMDLTKDKTDPDLFTSGKSRVIIGTLLMKKQLQFIKTQWVHQKYDETGSEMSADLFAARLGYGKELVTGLNRMMNHYFDYNEFVSVVNVMSIFFDLVVPSSLVLFGLAAGSIPIAVIAFMLLGVILYLSGTDNKDMTYDELKTRYVRVRQQLVELLKQSDLPNNEASSILNNIYEIDGVIKNTKPMITTVNRLADLFFTRHRDANQDYQLQRLLEELAHNDLFIKSAELNIAVKGA